MSSAFARLARGLSDDLRALSLAGPRTGIATRTASAAVLALVAALLLELENPWWAALTAFVIVEADARATLAKSIDRVLGTVIGAALGYLLAAFIADHVLFALLVGGTVALTLYAQERIEHGYAALLCGVTVVLVLFGSLVTPAQSLSLAVDRALEICVGVVVACAVDWVCAKDFAVVQAPAAKPGMWARPVDADLIAVALTGGVAVAAIPFIWASLQLPGLDQTPITAFVIMTAVRGDARLKAVNRAAGCLLGGGLGLLVLPLVGNQTAPWLAAIFTGLFVCAHIRHSGGDDSYAGQQAGVALILAMIQGSAPSTSLIPALDRLTGIVGGVLVVAVVQWALAPLARRLVARLSGSPPRR